MEFSNLIDVNEEPFQDEYECYCNLCHAFNSVYGIYTTALLPV
jgi:hypothetical protein